MCRRLLLLLLTFFALVPAAAQETPPSEAALIERILELRRQIDELMAQLPPDVRRALEERLAQPAEEVAPTVEASPPSPPEASAPPPPPPEPEAVAETPSPSPPPPPPRWRRNRISCNTLEAFDTNGDGTVNALDRYWRYLYLWVDRNGNSRMDKREVVSTFDEKVQEIAADLDAFVGRKGLFGEIRIHDRLVLDLRGNGFDTGRDRDDAVLLVDATALGRRDGPRLLSADGEEIEGVQPFQRGWRIRDTDGSVTRLTCP